MKKFLQIIFITVSIISFSQTISGNVSSEEGFPIPKVLVVNMKTDRKVYSNISGNFSIEAKTGDELRFAKENYQRGKVIIENNNFLTVNLQKIPQEIEEVKIVANRISDSQAEELRKSIGLPKAPEKPREKPAEVTRDVLFPLVFGQLNIQAVYDVLSGKARRLKRLYRYEDLQESLAWTRKNIDDDYFEKADIPKDKINDFLIFASQDEQVLRYMKAKNAGGLITALEKKLPNFLERIGKK